MDLKLFGDTQPVDWQALGVKMPFAPLHKLANDYKLHLPYLGAAIPTLAESVMQDVLRTFELPDITFDQILRLVQRINHRTQNTITALDQCSPDIACINIGGGMHHAGKTPDTGYAYSLINDIIWAVDHQLAKDPNQTVHIVDLDFHFGGGTFAYYHNNRHVAIVDHHNKMGILHQDKEIQQVYQKGTRWKLPVPTKMLFNLGTDAASSDAQFGKFNDLSDDELLTWWKKWIETALKHKIPFAVTFGGGYGETGLDLYRKLIDWLQGL